MRAQSESSGNGRIAMHRQSSIKLHTTFLNIIDRPIDNGLTVDIRCGMPWSSRPPQGQSSPRQVSSEKISRMLVWDCPKTVK